MCFNDRYSVSNVCLACRRDNSFLCVHFVLFFSTLLEDYHEQDYGNTDFDGNCYW